MQLKLANPQPGQHMFIETDEKLLEPTVAAIDAYGRRFRIATKLCEKRLDIRTD